MKRIHAYWLCQLGGWGSYILVLTFVYFFIRPQTPNGVFFSTALVDVIIGLGITHLMRFTIKKGKLTEYEIRKQIVYMVLTTILFSIVYSLIVTVIDHELNLESGWPSHYT